jgi:nucleolar MIF4G domain-containing protein 1
VEKKKHRNQSSRLPLPTRSVHVDSPIQPQKPLAAQQTASQSPHIQIQSKHEIKIVSKPSKAKLVERASPEPAPKPRVSRAVKAKLEEDDAEIAALEKKLGVKNKKKSRKAFDEDGDNFEALLDGLDDEVDALSGKRKRSDYDDYLASKRKRLEQDGSPDYVSDADPEDYSMLSGSQLSISEDSDQELDDNSEDKNSGVDFDGFDDDDLVEELVLGELDRNGVASDTFDHSDAEEVVESSTKKRENPYVAPAAGIGAGGKYIPPSLRAKAADGDQDLKMLRRQLQGLLNRLSAANVLSIVRDFEKAYASNARQHVTSVLIDLLMGLLCDRSALMDTFIILHAAFAAAIYKVIGSQFGAQLLERIVTDFDRLYGTEKVATSGSKETTNLIALLAELYTFQVVGSNVVFDYIRLFLADLSEINTELLLKVIKNCGPQLRHDDPSSLKDIVILLQKSVAKVGESQLPVRTKFMIETINDLKNNRQKAGAAASSVAAELTSRLKKTLGALNTQGKASEPLGVSLADLKSSLKEGKWWLVGASWKNEAQHGTAPALTSSDSTKEANKQVNEIHGNHGPDLYTLAKQQRMNTDIRMAIFMNIMSASDFKDAHMRLSKLKLRKAQELEIPRVLIHCAGAEQTYNPYYTLIAKQLCTEHRFKWAMQYGLWDWFKRMGEKSSTGEESDDEDDADEDENIDLKKIVNLGRMYGQLIADNALSLTSLKV